MLKKLVGLAAAGVTAYALFWPVAIAPATWRPLPIPVIAPAQLMSGVRNLPDVGEGPEAVAVSKDGVLYTGLQDGRIISMHADGTGKETLVQTGGRPLGMKFDARGNLIVADAFRGLLSISPEGRISVLADSVDGERMRFVNDLAIAADGTVWFSDSSRRFDQRHWMNDFWEARPTGRLLRYDAAAAKASVALDGLMFANGVALGPNDDFVVVAETLAARLKRYWLHGPRAGQTEMFGGPLPGYPDNLTFDAGGGLIWVALPSPRVRILEWMADLPSLRRVLFHIPEAVRDPKAGRMAWVVALDPEGRVVRNLQDPSRTYGPVTSVLPWQGRLYFGSIDTTAIGVAGR